MRIAIIIESFPATSETFISNKVKQLALRGHELIIFCNKKNDALYNSLFTGIKNVHVELFNKTGWNAYAAKHLLSTAYNAITKKNARHLVFSKYRVNKINNYKPDIIHFEFSGIGIDYLYELPYLKAKKVVSCRGSAEKVKLLVSDERKEQLKKLFTLTDAIHCVSDDMKRTILPYCETPEKIFINYPSIDAKYFTGSVESSKSIIPVILSIGRFTFQKGYLTGMFAVKKLKDRGINFKWMIVGNGQQYEEIVFHINQLQLNDVVELAGSKDADEIKSLIQHAAVCFLPSVYEGIANVALEAMSMQVPVVATRCGGMEEVIINGENGLLASVYDDEKLSEQLALLLEDKSLRCRMGKAARQTILDKFTIENQISKFESVYESLLTYQPKTTFATTNEKPVVKKQSSQLTIGLILAQFPTYSETFFVNLVSGLCKRDFNVIVFRDVKHNDYTLEKVYALDQYNNLTVVTFNFNKSFAKMLRTVAMHPFIVLKNAGEKKFKRKLYRDLCLHYLEKYKCDVYHFGYSGIAVSYLSLIRKFSGKKLVSCLGTAENVKAISEPGRKQKLYDVFQYVDAIHCISENIQNIVIKYGADKEKTFINRSAIDVNFFKRQTPYHGAQTIQILSAGRLVFQKGFLIGILAIHKLAQQYSNFIWKIAGEGHGKEEIISHINTLHLNDHIELIGRKTKNEMHALYKQADIFFLPSVNEGIANVVLEAMAMELPVVCSLNGGMGEVIEHNKNGMLSANYNHVMMAEQLYELCNDFNKRRALGVAGRKTVEENFNLENYLDVFEQKYRTIVNN